ncbi:MAG: metallophosphoesterase [Chloroflexi bacterium]|nr:metallophosphoesterase [Chloroflexota bacterium]
MRPVVLFASFAVAAAGCVPDQGAPGVASTATPQAKIDAPLTLTPSASPAPESTATRTPKPTNTPLPEVAFSVTAADIDYRVPLTLQRLTPFEAIVHFELERPGSGWLLYQPNQVDFRGWWATPLAEDQVSHQIPLVGLTPGTSYRVQVGLGEALESLRVPFLLGASWGPIRFETPALGEPDLRFAVIGDSGFGDDQTRELIELMESYDLDFVLHTGDSVYKANEESGPAEAFARKFFKMFAPLLHEVPIFPVLGNHDFDQPARSNGRPYFVRAFPALTDPSVPESALGTWYAFERSGVQFIMLDSHAFHGSGGRAEQSAWLEERLEDPSFRVSIPVFHTPPYTSGLHRNDGGALRLDWGPLFEAARVPLVLSGHDHNYERIERNGVTYVVSGGGSPVLYRETERVEGSQKFHRRMHFLLVEAAAEHLALTAIDIDGTVLDRKTIPLGSG